ncbi:MAG TPA: ABC transporter permease [Candidatus Pacearchaeota archaeon]|nr:ABC transporter permease [Candidatus Pacearchaeota archaeon]
MNLKYIIKTAYKGLLANKFRSFLTILGILIGIASIIMIVSIGQGAQNLILGEIQSMGSNNIFVLPGKQINDMSAGFQTIMDDSLKYRDLEELEKKSNVPHAVNVLPIVFSSSLVKYGSNTYRPMILGSTPEIMELYNTYPEQGDLFTNEDVSSKANVAVIGGKVKSELFGDEEAIGKRIKIKDKTFLVVGIFPKAGQKGFVNFDEMIFIPYSTAQTYVFGTKYYNRIIIEIDSEDNVKQSIGDIEETLRSSHGIEDSENDDFHTETTESLMKSISVVTGVLTLFLAAVASISLIVGGVGIMNIVLVSVSERTKEIGLRKALGATDKDILYQFLLESVFLTGLGGISGIIAGTLFSFLISYILTNFAGYDWPFSFSIMSAVLGFSVSALIGLVFGIYPAKKAAQLSPIEALRRE